MDSFKTDIMLAFWGFMGGAVRVLDGAVRTGTFPKYWVLIANVLISGFCGYISAQVADIISPQWVTVCAGIGGFLGTRAIDTVVESLTKINVKPGNDPHA